MVAPMSGWSDLSSLGVTVRPLTEPKPPVGDRYSPFSAGLTSTVELLATELRALEAERVVVELDLRERDIRLDGLPRADAKPSHDGVALAFESKFGPLRYATAEYAGRWGQPGWQANLRAIALSMQALRSVDRYGVSKRGEQYTGWRQLPSGSDDTGVHTRAQAEALLERYGGRTAAIKATHPDRNPDIDPVEFRRVTRAIQLMETTP
jgi:hypothetical protein